ncbi:LOW QUALITY PROTEIN: hypothetical protein MAR_017329 [Mya arenaria]|uniref:Integrase zinc-binding domain-containing protein n=1 Tax=Mya arenaria TaxID=6604 RepID=A0ABY7EEX1_MYAAR|nr:LOW QUALITY PROTEIN: hypothetical protein MAR_017329 [Mya arenaria]
MSPPFHCLTILKNPKRTIFSQSVASTLLDSVKKPNEGKPPSVKQASAYSPVVRHYVIEWDSMIMNNGLFFRRFKKMAQGNIYNWLCLQVCKNGMYHMHNSAMSGHLGQNKTKEKALQRYYWFGIREDIN